MNSLWLLLFDTTPNSTCISLLKASFNVQYESVPMIVCLYYVTLKLPWTENGIFYPSMICSIEHWTFRSTGSMSYIFSKYWHI